MANEGLGAGAVPPPVRRGRADALTVARRQRFLDVLAATANVRRAAAAASADHSAFYRLRSRDAEFAAAWRGALDDALMRLEGEVLARALGGAAGENGDGARVGDAERAGAVDVDLALNLLKRRDARMRREAAEGRVAQRRVLTIEELEHELLTRLDVLARRAGRA